MKAKWGAIVVSGSGKLSGNTVTTGSIGSVFSRKRTAKSQASSALARQNRYFSEICSTWKSLTADQKAAWISLPLSTVSAFDTFKNTNLSILVAGGTLISSPPGVSSVDQYPAPSVCCCLSQGLLRLAINVVFEPDVAIVVYASRCRSSSISFRSSDLRYIKSISSNFNFYENLYSSYIAVFGTTYNTLQHLLFNVRYISRSSGVTLSSFTLDCINDSVFSTVVLSGGTRATAHVSVNSLASFSDVYNGSAGTSLIQGFQVSSEKFWATENGSHKLLELNLVGSVLQSMLLSATANAGGNKFSDFWSNILLPLTGGSVLFFIKLRNFIASSLTYPSGATSIISYSFLRNKQVVCGPSASGSFLYSSNCGQTLSAIPNVIAGSGAMRLQYISSNIFIGYTLSPFSIYRSTDFLSSFSAVFASGLTATDAWIVRVTSTIVIVFAKFSTTVFKIYRSLNSGSTFALVHSLSSNFNNVFRVVSSNGNVHLTSSTSAFILSSFDFGSSFAPVPLPSGVSGCISFLAIDDNRLLAGCTTSAGKFILAYSSNGGTSYSSIYSASVNASPFNLLLLNNNFCLT